MSDLVLGIDEAGRGPVIGSLFLAGFLIEENDEIIDRLNYLGVNDSKLILPKKRDCLVREIRKIALGSKVFKINPPAIDKFSINDLEIRYSAKLVNHFSPHRVYMDVPASGRGIGRYCGAVGSLCSNQNHKIVGANKMDASNILVAAASVLAKSEREKHVKILRRQYGDFGSGYPSDPKTMDWLKWWSKNKGEWPCIVRRKWNTLNGL